MPNLSEIVIVGAARTPIGAFNGGFAGTPAHDLGAAAIGSAMARAGVEATEVSEVILGQVLSAGQGMNPARQAAISAGIPAERTAFGINQVCGSGLRSVAIGAQGLSSSFSAMTMEYLPGLPITPMSSIPLRAPPMLRMVSSIARPMAELAMLPGLKTPEELFIFRSPRTGPLTIQQGANEPVLVDQLAK